MQRRNFLQIAALTFAPLGGLLEPERSGSICLYHGRKRVAAKSIPFHYHSTMTAVFGAGERLLFDRLELRDTQGRLAAQRSIDVINLLPSCTFEINWTLKGWPSSAG